MKQYRKIGFLLAAGASYDLGLPTSRDVLKEFDRLMSAPNPQITPEDRYLYRKAKASLLPGESDDFEAIFDRLSMDPEDPNIPGTPEAKGRLSGILREHFVRMLSLDGVDPDNHLKKLGALLFWLGYPLEVFTLNQDLSVELYAGPHVRTGFLGYGPDHEWSEHHFSPDGSGLTIRLYKVHGSTNWQRNRRGRFFLIPPSQPINAAKAVLVLGHKEKVLSKLPYTFEFHQRRFAGAKMDLVVIVGFGFRDGHIIILLLDALRKGTDLLVVSPETSDSFRKFQARAANVIKTATAPGRVLLLRKTAKEFFMGLPGSLYRGVPADDNGA